MSSIMYYFLTKGMTQQVMDVIKEQLQREEEERRDVMMKQMKEMEDKMLGESNSTWVRLQAGGRQQVQTKW